MSVNTLHVTNGDSVLYTWKQAGLLGTHLSWYDTLYEGPVVSSLSLEELSNVRADFLATRGHGSAIKIHRELDKRNAVIRRAGEFDEIVLWFEHDLYDQLHLLQILAVLQEQGLGAGHVQLIQSEQFLGMLSSDEIMSLLPKRRFLTTAMSEGVAHAWNGFTSQSPQALLEAAERRYVGLPFLNAALKRLCEEYPATGSALSRTQRQLLEACAQGARRKEDLFRRSQAREEAAFMGDSVCYAHIGDLCNPSAPLLSEVEGGYEVTVLGRRVLAGDADWLEEAAVDRWIGGVQVTSERGWRWDEAAGKFIEYHRIHSGGI
jgi:hypothetical protein